MSIKLRTLVERGVGTDARIIIIDTQESWLHFQKLVQQGSSLYPDLPAEMRTFSDEVTIGVPLQSYEDGKADAANVNSEYTKNPTSKLGYEVCYGCGLLFPQKAIIHTGTLPLCRKCHDLQYKVEHP